MTDHHGDHGSGAAWEQRIETLAHALADTQANLARERERRLAMERRLDEALGRLREAALVLLARESHLDQPADPARDGSQPCGCGAKLEEIHSMLRELLQRGAGQPPGQGATSGPVLEERDYTSTELAEMLPHPKRPDKHYSRHTVNGWCDAGRVMCRRERRRGGQLTRMIAWQEVQRVMDGPLPPPPPRGGEPQAPS